MTEATEPFPFELPPTPEGFRHSLLKPQRPEDLDAKYLGALAVYIDQLKCFFDSGHATDQHLPIMSETLLHQARVNAYVLHQKHPEDPLFAKLNNPVASNSTGALTVEGIKQILQESLETNLDPIKKQLTTIQTEVNTLKNDVRTLKTDMGALDRKVNTVQTDMNELKKDVNTLKNDVGALKNDVGTLKNDVSALKNDVGTLKNDVGTLKTDMGALNRKVDTVQTDMNELRKDVDTLKTTVEGNKTSLAALTTRVRNLPNSDEFRMGVATAVSANQSIIQIQQTVDGHSGSLNDINTRLRRVDRAQCQIFNAGRGSGQSLLPIPNADGDFPSADQQEMMRNRDSIGSLDGLNLAKLLKIYGYRSNDPSFEPSSRRWSAQETSIHRNRLIDMLTRPETTFAPAP